jgi:hypothetical protein
MNTTHERVPEILALFLGGAGMRIARGTASFPFAVASEKTA